MTLTSTTTPSPPGGVRARMARAGAALGTLSGLPRIFRLVWSAHPTLSIALAALNVVQGLVPVAQAWLTKMVIDLIGAAAGGRAVAPAEVLWIAALFAAVAVAATAFEPTSTFVQVQLGDYLKKEIQTRILVKANSLADISYFEDPTFYDRLRRAQGDSGYRPLNVLHGAVQIFRSLVHLGSMLAVLVAFQPVLAVVAVLLALPSLVQQLKSQVQFWEISNVSVPEVRRMRYFAEQITGKDSAAELRLYNLGGFFLDRFQREFDAFHTRMRALRRRQARWEAVTGTLAELGSSAMYAWLVLQALARRLTLGDMSLYAQAVWQANGQIGGLVRQLSGMYADILFVGQLFEFLETPAVMPVTPPGEGRLAPRPLGAGIELRNVTFRYPGTERAVLQDLSLRIAPGESVALVGENGAGKTTIVKLLTRLYDPTEGAILIDGTDLREHDLDDWRRQTAAIFQDFTRYHLSARENVGLGDVARVAEGGAIAAAAARGGAAGVIEQLPAGYDTVLGLWLFNANNTKIEEGAEISGGEWQKVALSRGFMRSDDDSAGVASSEHASVRDDASGEASAERYDDDPGADHAPGEVVHPGAVAAPRADVHPGEGASTGGGAQLLILDEPTASLDTQSEYDVYLRFHALTKGKATLLISHRFSTVRMADRIVVLEDGRIAEQGSHQELLRRGGTYADLYEKQASRYR
ncbi:MAG: ABC transporter ATP-binding protein/permease [Chloroflexota bacterium]|nr:ABC transporter ATP-binding protein/permease [Chloroflexota bacterium]